MKKAVIILIVSMFFAAPAWSQLKSSINNSLFVQDESAGTSDHFVFSKDDFIPQDRSSAILELPRTKPGVALLSSAIIPGSAQAANGKWIRAGIYFTAEVLGVIYHLDRNATAKRQERAYKRFSHQNWSVLAYSQWLVEYSRTYDLNNGWQSLEQHIAGKNPDFSNTTNDWAKVDLNLLHQVERDTPYLFNNPPGCLPSECSQASNFSHELPEYGSQQFYELISKYYQFQPGWQDYYNTALNSDHPSYDPNHILAFMINGEHLPSTLFYLGRDRAEAFNDNYRRAGNILKLLLINHVVSAFDALFTVKLKNSKIETQANLLNYEQISIRWHF